MLAVMRRVRRFATTDGMGLLIIGAASIGRGISYSPPVMDPHTKASHVAESWATMDVWAIVWIGIGLLCVGSAFAWRSRAAAVAVGLAVGIHALWSVSFLWGTLAGDSPRGYVSALSYGLIAVLALWAFGRGSREDGEGVPDA